MKREYIDKNPVRNARNYTVTKTKSDLVIPTKEEVSRILDDARKWDDGRNTLPIYPLILLAVATGMRIGELLNLDRERDIDQDKGTIDISKQVTREGRNMPLKTDSSSRIIHVNKSILKEVLDIVPIGKTSALWNNSKGEPTRYLNATARVRDFLEQEELPDGFTFHMFRHYHATTLLSAGNDVKNVSKRLGHKSVKTTYDCYSHWIPEQDKSIADQFGEEYIV